MSDKPPYRKRVVMDSEELLILIGTYLRYHNLELSRGWFSGSANGIQFTGEVEEIVPISVEKTQEEIEKQLKEEVEKINTALLLED